MVSRFLAYATLVSLALSEASARIPLAGNEDYAYTRNLTGMQKREDNSMADQSLTITFSTGSGDSLKEYLSPNGPMFKRYFLKGDWGLGNMNTTPVAVTVFNVDGEVSCASLNLQVEAFAAADDVWDTSFLKVVILQTTTSFHVNADVAECLKGLIGDLIVKSGNATSDVKGVGLAHVEGNIIPHGPYMATTINGDLTLTEVYRSYRDEAQACTAGIITTIDNTFVDLSGTVPGMNTISIPVPSRLYSINRTDSLPLAGLRIVVKDIYDLAGLRTGCGNRAYYNTYQPRSKTAVSIQRLIDQGAVIVGKAKTSSFANGEGATSDWVDQMCPYNPRADGYQQPSSSSSGPGAAIASYAWLDASIGSDTGCSILCPSAANGVFGMRPTWGSLSLEGVMPLEPILDTAGFLCRDPTLATKFSRAWYGDSLVEKYDSFPKTLHFPTSSWTFSSDSLTSPLYNRFRRALTDLIKPTTVDSLSDESVWNNTGQFATHSNTSVDSYLGVGYGIMIDYNQWNTFGAPWFTDYAAQNDGRTPFVAPSPRIRWAYGRVNVTANDYQEAVSRKQEYAEWFNSNVLVPDNRTCSDSVYVTTWTGNDARPSYRDTYSGPPSAGLFGYGIYNYAGVPQLNIPIGQVPYNSSVTNHVEYLPVTVSLNAARGCDYMLWDIAAALPQSGAISAVNTGRTGFPCDAKGHT